MSNNNADAPKPERTFVYTLARFLEGCLNHTLFPVQYHHKERFDLAGPYILIANHHSMHDPLMVSYACKRYEIRWLGKKELTKYKWVAKLLDVLHMITVDRHNSDLAAMRECLRVLRDGQVLGIFPEGTRHHEGLMEEIETGTAVLALRANVPLLPVYIDQKARFLRCTHVFIGNPMDLSDLAKQGTNTQTIEALTERIQQVFAALKAERPTKGSEKP